MFKKRNKAQNRVRSTAEQDDEDEAGDEAPSIRPTSTANRKKDKSAKDSSTKSSAGKGLLSFGDEEEETPFDIARRLKAKQKDSGGAHKHATKIDREKGSKASAQSTGSSSAASVGGTQAPQAGLYTADYLAELQRGTNRIGGTKPSASGKPVQSAPTITLAGSFKPTNVDRDNLSDTVDAVAPVKFPPSEQTLKQRSGAQQSGGKRATAETAKEDSGKAGDAPFIPDAATIAAAKAKRERLRQAKSDIDYMPIRQEDAEAAGVRALSGPFKKDEGSSDEGEEDESVRLQFLPGKGNGKDKAAPEGGVFSAVRGEGDEEEEGVEKEDEEDRWMLEQLRKGVGGSWGPQPAARGQKPSPAAKAAAAMADTQARISQMAASRAARSAAGGDVASGAVHAMEGLRKGLEQVRAAHAHVQQQLQKTEAQLQQSMAEVADLEQATRDEAAKYESMQEMKSYVGDLCDCLGDKAPIIEELEEHLQRTTEQRCQALVQRRRADRAEESMQADHAIGAALDLLSRRDATTAAAAAAAAAASTAALASADEESGGEVDEFGRDLGLGRRMEAQQRRAARAARRDRAQQRRTAPGRPLQRELGETSSEESEGEVASYDRQMDEVMTTAGAVYKDTASEYAELGAVKRRFEQWKAQYPSAYRSAYVGMTAPAVFAPFVRLQLLDWSPLFVASSLDSQPWYSLLFDYGVKAGAGEEDPEDPDNNLVPALMHKVALPVLQHAVDCWEVYSTAQTTRLADALKELLVYLPEDAAQDLLDSVKQRLVNAVAEIMMPAWPAAAVAVAPVAAQLAARRYGEALRLIRNICLVEDASSGALPLASLVLDEIVSRCLVPHLYTVAPQDAAFRAERLFAVLPAEWITASLPRPLQAVQAAVMAIGARLDKPSPDAARRVAKMLLTLRDHNSARTVAKEHGIDM